MSTSDRPLVGKEISRTISAPAAFPVNRTLSDASPSMKSLPPRPSMVSLPLPPRMMLPPPNGVAPSKFSKPLDETGGCRRIAGRIIALQHIVGPGARQGFDLLVAAQASLGGRNVHRVRVESEVGDDPGLAGGERHPVETLPAKVLIDALAADENVVTVLAVHVVGAGVRRSARRGR